MTDAYPHRYTGPTTRWGLRGGIECKILRRLRGGLVSIQTPDGDRWRVPAKQVRVK
jgi:hypothetical protein